MIRQPPTYVPAAIASVPTRSPRLQHSKSAARSPDATRASAMIPIVFCASFVPWVNATKPPETSCARRNQALIFDGERPR